MPPSEADGARLLELGTVLARAREAAGMTLRDLGRIAGDPRTLQAIEQGKYRTRSSRLRPWMLAVGLDPEPLLERFAGVIAPERRDGSTFEPWSPPSKAEPVVPPPPVLADHDVAALGAELWRIRARADLTRPELAHRLGVTRFHVWAVEHAVSRPSADLVSAWLDAAASDVDRLLFAVRFPGQIAERPPARWVGAHRSVPARTREPQEADR